MIVSAKRLRRRRRSLHKKNLVRMRAIAFQDLIKDPETGLSPVYLYAPEVFTVSSARSRTQVLAFIAKIRRAIAQDDRRVFIDFSRTWKMIADGTLLFYAEVDRLVRATKPRKMIKCSYPSDKIVEQVLQQVGFFRVLGKHEKAHVDHDTVRHWNTATGTKVDGQKIAPVQEFYQGTMANPLVSSNLYDGIVEAMSNCSHHAYPHPRKRIIATVEADPRWWMFSQERDGLLSVVFCDLGIGIPASVTQGVKWEHSFISAILMKIGLGSSDGALIRAAFEIGNSQTGEVHRGKGLQNIKDVLDKQKQGNLSVLSGYGFYIYKSDGSYQEISNFAEPVRGTLIAWSLPLQNEETDGKHN